MGGEGLLDDHTGTSQTDIDHGRGDYDCTVNNADHNLPDADNHYSLPAGAGERVHPPDEDDAPPVSTETIVHNLHLHHTVVKTFHMVAMTEQSFQPPAHINHLTRSQLKISADALIIIPRLPHQ